MTGDLVPHHVAIVMDGNGRWANKRLLPRIAGHKQGVDSLKRCAKACDARGIRVLTVFAFSSENWQRPVDEVSGLMDLFAFALGREVPQLKADGVKYKAGTFPFLANGRARALGDTTGMVKFLADASTDEILGVHIVGPMASELIAEAVVAMEFKASAEDIARICHAHPSLSEATKEAALAVDKRTLNF